MAPWNIGRYLLLLLYLELSTFSLNFHMAAGDCTVPRQFHGDYFSMERGIDVTTLINADRLENNLFEGNCLERKDLNDTRDAFGNYNSLILFHDPDSDCYKCYHFIYRTPNIIQYQQSGCHTPNANVPSFDDTCGEINQFTSIDTFFRTTLRTVNCRNTIEGMYQFSYEMDVGGGGICNSDRSQIEACQEPGSPYVDNQVFNMRFARCPDVTSSVHSNIRFQCMGTWDDGNGNRYSGVADLGQVVHRERFRCMLTRLDQEVEENNQRWTMSWWAECSSLHSPYDGPIRLVTTPIVGGYQLTYSQPTCNFPTNFSGHWYHWGEYDVDVDINQTHIYFRSQLDQFTFQETYFVCLMNSGTRYLTVALSVGKCEIDFVCFDMLPRHHSIIRWRMSRPYRLTEVEMAMPDYDLFMFRQACSWWSYTIGRNHTRWNYNTFLLNPPVPEPCPIRGRYRFVQTGPPSELYQTRIRGVTEWPRHMIDCPHYTAEAKSCDEAPSRFLIDAEYCETLDHTGRPIGYYDEADWEMTCVGYWVEDWQHYMITYDPEDATSPYRCWNYDRTDWRHVRMSRSTGAQCPPHQRPTSAFPHQGASLRLEMEVFERIHDDCAQDHLTGTNPWDPRSMFLHGSLLSSSPHTRQELWVLLILIVSYICL